MLKKVQSMIRFLPGLTHCILVDFSTFICWTNPFVILGVSGLLLLLFYFGWKILLANTVDPDQMPPYVASDLGLHCLPVTLLWVSSKNELN